MPSGKRYQLDEETTINFENVQLTDEEYRQLKEVTGGHRASGSDPAHIDQITLDTEKLAQMAFEYELLKQVASTVEIEVLRFFRESEQSTLTTGEISTELSRSKSSVSRALTRLVEKAQLEQVQQGVYRSQIR